MMNKRIRSMIDEIFSDMKMSAENLALRDELMANAQARYEDMIAQGRSEEEAFREVAASLEDVYGLLEEMKRMDAQPQTGAEEEKEIPELKTGTEPEEAQESAEEETQGAPQTDLGDALNKAFTALGDFGQAIMPEAKKLYGQMDNATGGVLGKLGRAAKKGMLDAQKAAGDAIDKLSKDSGELVFDFGANKEAELQEDEAQESAEEAPAQEEAKPFDAAMDDIEDEFARAVDEVTREAEEVIREAAQDAEEYVVRDADEPVVGRRVFPAAALHKVDIQVDADDVEILPADGSEVETIWEAHSVDGEPVITMSGHTLTIRRKNPDVFKTFFSVFQKAGGRIAVRVPCGYGAGYAITTTSGDVRIGGIDVDSVKVSATSGSVRVEPDTKTRAADIAVTTVSGHAAVSACADTIAVTTVSGGQFISCDAHKVDVNVVSGKVHVEGACDEWEVSAVSSEVELLCTVAPTKKVQISSVHGDVRLALPGEIRGFVAESTGALGCEIINEFGPNRYGTCALPIRMETMHGKLLITRL